MLRPDQPTVAHRAIGILDSGWGGLSIWQSIIEALPHESTCYIGDHRFIPYGNKPPAVIQSRVFELLKFFVSKRVKLAIIACNTATVAGIEAYRTHFPTLPIIGVVPVVKTAAEVTKARKFLVLSTPYTAASHYQKNLIQEFASDCQVYNIGSSRLVQLIERGKIQGKAITKELTKTLHPYVAKRIDVIALGCTHYPFVRQAIRAIVGKNVQILDSGGAVARQTQRVLFANHALSTDSKPTYTFFTTGETNKTQNVARLLLGRAIRVYHAAV